ncbi:MAG: hypothetical protein ACI8W8_003799, partial [Rhodothermales bacterium]
MKSTHLLILLFLASPLFAQDALPSPQEMWRIIQQQSKQIQALQSQVQALTGTVDDT